MSTDVDGKTIDFNEVYDSLIHPAITGEAMQQAGGLSRVEMQIDFICAVPVPAPVVRT
jgi:hypothetical protein